MGKKNWIYVIKEINTFDKSQEEYYVGTTSKLFTRLKQHLSYNGGCKNTQEWCKQKIELVALYKGEKDGYLEKSNVVYGSLPDHDLDMENYITKCYMLYIDNPEKVKGGKFTQNLNAGDSKELYDFHGKEHLLIFEITCGDLMTGKRF